jgi:NADPH:quinone reductase-like Zn-dependent oxidoreductase
MADRTARGVRIHQFGGPEVLSIERVAVPPPAKDEVRLNIEAIGLNRTEITLRSGRSPNRPPLPAQIGFEAAAAIESIGDNVTGYRRGDRVALIPSYGASQYGLYGEVALAPARSLVRIPDGTSSPEAAATWVAFGTAWCGLVAVGNLQAGQTVLISAASSSVGLAAIQTANRIEARPIALTRAGSKAEALIRHGAAHVIVTSEQDVQQEVNRFTDGRGVDLVFDAVGGPAFSNLVSATRNGGLLVLYGALEREATHIPPFDIFGRDLTIRGFALPVMVRDDVRLAELRSWVQSGLQDGTLKPTVANIFTLEQIVDAHRFMESGTQIGKVVVVP